MVPSLHEWLTRKQKETRRGRAELRLAERAAAWTTRPEPRNLPSLTEWARIRLFTRSRAWTKPERTMMRRADGRHLLRCSAVIGVILLVGLAINESSARANAQHLRDRLLGADVASVPLLLEEMGPHRRRVQPLLQDALTAYPDPKHQRLLRLGLVRWNRNWLGVVQDDLLTAEAKDFAAIRQVLAPYKDELIERLWSEINRAGAGSDHRLRAACALVDYLPDGPQREAAVAVVISGITAESPTDLHHWRDALQGVKTQLLPALATSLENTKWGNPERRAIIDFYRDYSDGNVEPLKARFDAKPSGESEFNRARRQATLAAALAAIDGTYQFTDYLEHTPNPTMRSFLIERLAWSGVSPKWMKDMLDAETRRPSVRLALILALGGYRAEVMPSLVPYLLNIYETDGDAGIHGAACWVLREWKQTNQVDVIDKRLSRPLAKDQVRQGYNWFVNGDGQTYSIISQPRWVPYGVEQVARVPPHRFAISSTEITVRQFRRFKGDYKTDASVVDDSDWPVSRVSWHEAAAYCNWLSQREGLQPCYRAAGHDTVTKQDLFEFVEDYWNRDGYRLATEYEWEFACKAGADTKWYFGEADHSLLNRYARWRGNSFDSGSDRCSGVALLKPNDWGLFDMHGNLAEWCQEAIVVHQNAFFNDVECVVRGGSYSSSPQGMCADSREPFGRKMRSPFRGFRLVRTLSPPE
jgi:hypothetical protein